MPRRRASGSRCRLRRFDIDRVPDAIQSCRQPGCGTHQFFVAGVIADAQQDCVAGVPDLLPTLAVPPGPHLIVNPIGGAAQRQFTQGNQIAFAKEVLNGAFGLVGNIDFALFQPLA